MFTIRYYFTDGSAYTICPGDVTSWKIAIQRAKAYFQVVAALPDGECSSVWIDRRKNDRVVETRIFYYGGD